MRSHQSILIKLPCSRFCQILTLTEVLTTSLEWLLRRASMTKTNCPNLPSKVVDFHEEVDSCVQGMRTLHLNCYRHNIFWASIRTPSADVKYSIRFLASSSLPDSEPFRPHLTAKVKRLTDRQAPQRAFALRDAPSGSLSRAMRYRCPSCNRQPFFRTQGDSLRASTSYCLPWPREHASLPRTFCWVPSSDPILLFKSSHSQW